MFDISLIDPLIDLAIKEDVGSGDITTDSIIDENIAGQGIIIAKENLIAAGIDVAKEVFLRFDPDIVFSTKVKDGDTVNSGDTFIEITGKLKALLTGERTALNFLQRLCGIATHVRAYVNELGEGSIKLVDTRKTTPGWRVLEKYAVRTGGAHNHRMGLYDGVLIKDNHIAAAGGIKEAVEKINRHTSHLVKIEVEVSNMEEVKEAVSAGADIIMLDNMNADQIDEAITIINKKALVEISGNVDKDMLRQLKNCRADIVSSGALTHSAKAVDISMKISSKK